MLLRFCITKYRFDSCAFVCSWGGYWFLGVMSVPVRFCMCYVCVCVCCVFCICVFAYVYVCVRFAKGNNAKQNLKPEEKVGRKTGCVSVSERLFNNMCMCRLFVCACVCVRVCVCVCVCTCVCFALISECIGQCFALCCTALGYEVRYVAGSYLCVWFLFVFV